MLVTEELFSIVTGTYANYFLAWLFFSNVANFFLLPTRILFTDNYYLCFFLLCVFLPLFDFYLATETVFK